MSFLRRSLVQRVRLAVEPLEARFVPAVTYHGGALLPHVEVQGVYLGSDWASTALNQATATYDNFLSDLVNSAYMDMLTNAGYGVGRGTTTAGRIDATVLDRTHFLSDATIQNILQADVSSGALAVPDANRLYVVYLEPNVAVQLPDGTTSVNDLTGYHGAFAGQRPDGTPAAIRYAVLPYPGGSVGNQSFGPGYTAFQDATVVSAHEIAEATTDPDIGYSTLGWYDNRFQAEISDLAQGNFVNLHGYLLETVVAKNDQVIVPTDTTLAEYAAAAFPGHGVFRYSTATGWQQLSGVDASAVAVDSNGDVVASFPGAGVFRYENATGWQGLTPYSASAVSIAGAGSIAASFPGAGVYRFEDGIGWQGLTPVAANQLAIDAHGDVVGNFPGAGVYRYEDATGWQGLSAFNALSISIAGNAIVAASFQGAGVFRYQDTTGWQGLTPLTSYSVSINARGDVAADFPGEGVFRYRDVTGWQSLPSADAYWVSIASNGDVLGGFQGHGVWLWRPSTGWQQLTGVDASSLSLATL
jgi:hypothetical protein